MAEKILSEFVRKRLALIADINDHVPAHPCDSEYDFPLFRAVCGRVFQEISENRLEQESIPLDLKGDLIEQFRWMIGDENAFPGNSITEFLKEWFQDVFDQVHRLRLQMKFALASRGVCNCIFEHSDHFADALEHFVDFLFGRSTESAEASQLQESQCGSHRNQVTATIV